MSEEKKLILSLGSNINHKKNIDQAVSLLQKMFGNDKIVSSRQLWTNPIDIKSDKFLNCILFIYTSYGLDYIEKGMKELEQICGSSKVERDKNIIKIDIDILMYDNKRMHEKDWSRGYIKDLMKDSPF